VKANSIFETQ